MKTLERLIRWHFEAAEPTNETRRTEAVRRVMECVEEQNKLIAFLQEQDAQIAEAKATGEYFD